MSKNYIGHCHCGYTLFAEEDQITNGTDWRKLYPPEARRVKPEDSGIIGVYAHCDVKGHKAFRLYEITGKYNPDHKCDDRCKFAKGNDCTCSCGGANHGRGHAQEVQAKLPEVTNPNWQQDAITDPQKGFIRKLMDEREISEESRTEALDRLDSLTKGQAKAWIDKLLTKPKR